MSRFRRQGQTKLVSPYLKQARARTVSRKTITVTGRRTLRSYHDHAGKAGRGDRRGGAVSRQMRRVETGREVKRIFTADDSGQALERVGTLAGRAGGRVVGRQAGRYARQAGRAGAARSWGLVRSTGVRVRVAGSLLRAPVGRVGRRAGRQVGRGVRRVGHAAARAVQVAAVKVAAAVAALAGSVGGTGVAAAALVVAMMMVILSFLPSWVANLVVDDEIIASGVAMGDDYPWAGLVRGGDGQPLDAYNTVNPDTNYYYGNCTDFVFWRVNRDMGGVPGAWVYTRTDLTPKGGNGRQWGKEGNLPGWETITNPKDARTGDIISFETGTLGHDSPYGHVAYVARLTSDGDIVTENYGSARYYVETINAGQARELIASGDLVIKRNPQLQFHTAGASSNAGNGAVGYAMKKIGTPYRSGSPPGYLDCCGLVRDAFLYGAGVRVPMSVPGNPWATSKCEYAMYSLASSYGGTLVPLEQARPGDIVFFQAVGTSKAVDNLTHVAIYGGGGNVIDAVPRLGVGVRPLGWYAGSDAVEPYVVRVGD